MDAKKALNIVAGQCSKKEYCSADVLAKLRRWELPEKDIAEIMAFLVKNRFLDDTRFAEAYARDKFRFNRWGKLKIAQMLRRKQVADSVIGQALAALPEEDTDATCMELLRQKNKSIKDEDPYKRKAKLIRFALSRGFEYETVNRCLSHLAHFL
ncbi:regulatory protein RecX [Butyricimonas hominis]|uniref:Regulatory protein RecX n=1 Tax=Butyricimonas hominis TaxID=2763032 RepID=A0ABR7D5C0_9BACT|nr:RecX family transcriptional regulator [Butyricimonas hominis]